ncbi:MAG: hypothetical protein ABWX96_16140 [Propionibacteriaceae bacterium]
MPAADTVLLPLAVGLTLLGIIATGIAWRRGNRSRVIQGVALALAPVALYFSGLLRLLWNGIVAIGTWASQIIFSPAVWFGLSLLTFCIVLWVIGAFVARRFPSTPKQKAVAAQAGQKGAGQQSAAPAAVKGAAGKSPATRNPAKGKTAAPPVDDDMAEIEALLKSRGIN